MPDNNPDKHGGNLEKASRLYGVPPEEWLDYSANINPLGPPSNLRKLLLAGMAQLTHYPDPDCLELKEAIARYLSVSTEQIIIGNGASEIIALILDIWRPRKVLIPAPTFSEYANSARRLGIQPEFFPLKEENNFQLVPKSLYTTMQTTEADMLFLCNPNNPTSVLLDTDTLCEIVAIAKQKNIKVVIDEAFIELTAGANRNSLVGALRQYANLFIIRAFTKLFAIPGLRLGYGLGSGQVIKQMWEQKLPWSVNTFACRLGGLLTDENEYLQRTAAWLTTEQTWFYEQLACFKMLKVFPPASNFILVKILEPGIDSCSLRQRLANQKILIRDASNFTFLNDRFVRFAIRDRSSNLRFLQALSNVLEL